MGTPCYSGLIEAYRQAFMHAVHSAANKLSNIHMELKISLRAETEFAHIIRDTERKYATLISPEAENFMINSIVSAYEDIIHSPSYQNASSYQDPTLKGALGVELPPWPSRDVPKNRYPKNNFGGSGKGQSHKNYKGGCRNGWKDKK